jgi:hypothetical protein
MLCTTRINRYKSRTNNRVKLMEWKHKYGEMGSKGNNYIVTRTHKNGNESFECSCPATMYRPWLQACKHIKRLKEKLLLP